VLFLKINPVTVDVNVHPAKLEVKFSNEKPVFEAIYYAVRNALEQSSARPSVSVLTQSRGRTNEWAPKGVSANMPIEDGRRESLKARQIETELYTASKSAEKRVTTATEGREPTPPLRAEATAAPKAVERSQTVQDVQETRSEAKPIAPQRAEGPSRPTEQMLAVPPTVVREERSAPTAPVMEEQRSAADRVSQAEEIVSAPINENPEAAVSGGSLSYRIIGEAFNSYVIVERGDVMLLVDKHAAHERIIFEGLKEGLRNASVTSQMLMEPLEVMMTSDEIQTLTESRSEIEAKGFEFT
jgi:DNA mismatch repair protein MutL